MTQDIWLASSRLLHANPTCERSCVPQVNHGARKSPEGNRGALKASSRMSAGKLV